MSKPSDASKPVSEPKPSGENGEELDEKQLDAVSGGIIIVNSRDALTENALGGPDTKMGQGPQLNPLSLTPKTGG